MGASPEIEELRYQLKELIEAREKRLKDRYTIGWGKGYLTAWAQVIVGWLVVLIFRKI